MSNNVIRPDEQNIEKRRLINKLPVRYRSEPIDKFFNSVLDNFFQPPAQDKLNNFIGRKPVYFDETADYYVQHPTKSRFDYSLEPATVVVNDDGVVNNVMTYPEFVDDIRFKGGLIDNPNRLFSQDYYSWHPPINADKITNFGNYYWIRSPITPIEITIPTNINQDVKGKKEYCFEKTQKDLKLPTSMEVFEPNEDNFYTFSDGFWGDNNVLSVEIIDENDNVISEINKVCWDIDVRDSQATLSIEQVEFEQGQRIKVKRDPNVIDVSGWDFTGNNVEIAVRFFFWSNSPSIESFDGVDPRSLSQIVSNQNDMIQLTKILKLFGDFGWDDLPWDPDRFVIPEGLDLESEELCLTNGLVVIFRDDNDPKNNNKPFIVEGVGRSIRFVEDEFLTSQDALNFFEPDYITIERSSVDNNPWSIRNRWFHKDLLSRLGTNLETVQAKRPIIEFIRDIELYNFGTIPREAVDLVITDESRLDQYINPNAQGADNINPNFLYINETFNEPDGSENIRVTTVNSQYGQKIVDISQQIAGWNTLWDGEPWDQYWWDGDNQYYSQGVSDLSIDGVSLFDGMRILVTSDNNPSVNNRIYLVDCISETNKIKLKLETDGQSDDGSPVTGETVRVRAGLYRNRNFYFDGVEWKQTQVKFIPNQEPLFNLYDVNGVSLGDTSVYPETNFEGNKVFSYDFRDDSSIPTDSILNNRLRRDDFGEPLFVNNKVVDRYQYADGEITGFYFHKENIDDPENIIFSNDWHTASIPSIQRYVEEFSFDEDSTNEVSLSLPPTLEDGKPLKDPISLEVYLNDEKLVQDIGYSIQQNGDIIRINENLIRQKLREDQFARAVITTWNDALLPSNDTGYYEIPLNLQANALSDEVDYISRSQILPQFIDNIISQDNFEGSNFNVNLYRDSERKRNLGRRILQHTAPLAKAMALSTTKSIDFSLAVRYVDREYNRFRNKFVNTMNRFYKDGTFTEQNTSEEWVEGILKSINSFKNQDSPFFLSGVGGGNYWIPATPSYLGVYPSYKPKFFRDRTFLVPQDTIIGHDGSMYIRVGDFRDDIILSFEQKIYDSILDKFKGENRPELDPTDIMPGKFRKTDYTREEFDRLLQPAFERWVIENRATYRTNEQFDTNNPWTWNYSNTVDIFGETVPGYWYQMYRYYFDTIRPNTTPWEMLGFVDKPDWWDEEYGPGPTYTIGNTKMWSDIENGIIRQGPRAGEYNQYKRPDLLRYLPVDASGFLLSPIEAGIIDIPPTYSDARADFKFGDGSPTEEAWRRSNSYPFGLAQALFLAKPSIVVEQGWDTENITFINLDPNSPQIINTRTRNRPLNKNLQIHGELDNDNNRVRKIGIQQWISDRICEQFKNPNEDFAPIIKSLDVRLSYRHSGFTNPQTLRFTSESFGIIPQEDYTTVLNKSPSISEHFYSGVVIIWTGTGYKVWGYDVINPVFKVIPSDPNGRKRTIPRGDVRIPVNDWKPNVNYTVNDRVEYQGEFFAAVRSHRSSLTFEEEFWEGIPQPVGPPTPNATRLLDPLPGNPIAEVCYGEEFSSINAVVEFLVSYQRWLEYEGWVFDEINSTTGEVNDFEVSAINFINWTKNRLAKDTFVTYSPLATRVRFRKDHGFVESVEQIINGVYSIVNVQGFNIDNQDTIVNRFDNQMTITTTRTEDAQKNLDIYGVRLFLSEYEHITVFSNRSVFNDQLYNPLFNIRIDRMKLNGIRLKGWNGRLFSPGYVITDNESFRNFQKVTSDFSKYYNVDEQVDDPTLRNFANHLIGFQPRGYLDNLVVSDTSQVNFFQGFIRQKGTRGVFDSLLRSNLVTDVSNFTFYEEWGVKLQDYGATELKQFLELQIDQKSLDNNPHLVELKLAEPITENENLEDIIKSGELDDNPFNPAVEIIDLFDTNGNLIRKDPRWRKRPTGKNNFFPVRERQFVDDKEILIKGDFKTAGYVVPSEITRDYFYGEELLTAYERLKEPDNAMEEPTLIQPGDTFWIYNTGNLGWSTFKFDWNVLKLVRPIKNGLFIERIENVLDQGIVIKTINPHNLRDGDLIVITPNTLENNDSPIDGSYLVEKVLSGTEFVLGTVNPENFVSNPDYKEQIEETDLPEIDLPVDFLASENEEDVAPIPTTQPEIWVYQEMRFVDRQTLNNKLISLALDVGDYVWIDDDRILDNLGKKIGKPRWSTRRVKELNEEDIVLELVREQGERIDNALFSNTIVYNEFNNEVVGSISVFDPLKGLIPGLAEQEINYKLEYDPAKYNNGDNTIHQIDPDQAWADEKVGEIWWDLSTLRYLDYEIDSNTYRQQNWGRLAPSASIDIYEWVRSPVPPSGWADLVAEQRGTITENSNNKPSGSALDPENPAWTEKTIIDTTTDTTVTFYYFWVKNVITIPPVDFRNISSARIARIIEDPTNAGIPWFAIINKDSFVLGNTFNLATDNKTVFQLNWKKRDSDSNIHREWVLLREDDPTSIIPENLYSKLIDSIVGLDKFDNEVPNPDLDDRDKVGISYRPRQSMFLTDEGTNKSYGARRAAVESINQLMSTVCLDDERLSWDRRFNQEQPVPTDVIEIVDTLEDRDQLYFEGKLNVEGQIAVRGIPETEDHWTLWEFITDNATGWDSSPWDTTGNEEVLTNVVELFWDPEDLIEITDENNITTLVPKVGAEPNKKVIQVPGNVGWDPDFDPVNGVPEFKLVGVQQWKLNNFWREEDWFEEGYKNVFPTITVENLIELNQLSDEELEPQDIIRVNDDSSGSWALYEYNPTETQIFKKVGKDNCTFALSEQLYNPNSESIVLSADELCDLGENLQRLRETIRRRDGTYELRELLNIIKEDVFTNFEQNRFFFDMINFAHVQQKFINWIFKTSYVTISGFNERLLQSPIRRVDVSESLLEFFGEAKPFHTKIREFTRSFSAFDEGQFRVTDFDKPIIYDPDTRSYRFANPNNPNDQVAVSSRQGQEYFDNFEENEVIRKEIVTLRFDRLAPVNDLGANLWDDEPWDSVVWSGRDYNKSQVIILDGAGLSEYELPQNLLEKDWIDSISVINETDYSVKHFSRNEWEVELRAIRNDGSIRIIDFVNPYTGPNEVLKAYLKLNDIVQPNSYIRIELYWHAIERAVGQYHRNENKGVFELGKQFKGIDYRGTILQGTDFKRNRFDQLYGKLLRTDEGWQSRDWQTEPWDEEISTSYELNVDEQNLTQNMILDRQIEGGIPRSFEVYCGDGERRNFPLPKVSNDPNNWNVLLSQSSNSVDWDDLIYDENEGWLDPTGQKLSLNTDYTVFNNEIVLVNPLASDSRIVIAPSKTWIPAPKNDWDVNIEGGKFLQPQLGPDRPEEMIPVGFWDPIDIIVEQKSIPGVPSVNHSKCILEKETDTLKLFDGAQHIDAVIIIVDDCKLQKDIDYTIDFDSGLVKFNNTIEKGKKVSSTYFTIGGSAQILQKLELGRQSFTSDYRYDFGLVYDENQILFLVNGEITDFFIDGTEIVSKRNLILGDDIDITVFDSERFNLVILDKFKGSDGPELRLSRMPTPVEPKSPRFMVLKNGKVLNGPDIQYFKTDGIRNTFELQNTPKCHRDVRYWIDGKEAIQEEVIEIGTWSYGCGWDTDVWDADFDPLRSITQGDPYGSYYGYGTEISGEICVNVRVTNKYLAPGCYEYEDIEECYTPCPRGYPVDGEIIKEEYCLTQFDRSNFDINNLSNFDHVELIDFRLFVAEEISEMDAAANKNLLNPFGDSILTEMALDPTKLWLISEVIYYYDGEDISNAVSDIQDIIDLNTTYELITPRVFNRTYNNEYNIKINVPGGCSYKVYDPDEGRAIEPAEDIVKIDGKSNQYREDIPGTWDYCLGWDEDVWDADFDPEIYPLEIGGCKLQSYILYQADPLLIEFEENVPKKPVFVSGSSGGIQDECPEDDEPTWKIGGENLPPEVIKDVQEVEAAIQTYDVEQISTLVEEYTSLCIRMANPSDDPACTTYYYLCHFPTQPPETKNIWVTKDRADILDRCPGWDPIDFGVYWDQVKNRISYDDHLGFAIICDRDDCKSDLILREAPNNQSNLIIINPSHDGVDWTLDDRNGVIHLKTDCDPNDDIEIIYFNDYYKDRPDNTYWDEAPWDNIEWDKPVDQETEMKIRTHTFNGTSEGIYIISRPPYSGDFMTVVVNGEMKMRGVDYELRKIDSAFDVKSYDWGYDPSFISLYDQEETWEVRFPCGHTEGDPCAHNTGDQITITTYSGTPRRPEIAWKMFNNPTDKFLGRNEWEYNKVLPPYTYYLKNDLRQNDESIDLWINNEIPRDKIPTVPLFNPSTESNIPGVLYIKHERIEYWNLEGPFFDDDKEYWTVSNLTRGTKGTSHTIPDQYNDYKFTGDGINDTFILPQAIGPTDSIIVSTVDTTIFDLGWNKEINGWESRPWETKETVNLGYIPLYKDIDYEVRGSSIVFNEAPQEPILANQPNILISVKVSDYTNSDFNIVKGTRVLDGTSLTQLKGGYNYYSSLERNTPFRRSF